MQLPAETTARDPLTNRGTRPSEGTTMTLIWSTATVTFDVNIEPLGNPPLDSGPGPDGLSRARATLSRFCCDETFPRTAAITSERSPDVSLLARRADDQMHLKQSAKAAGPVTERQMAGRTRIHLPPMQ
jgi:hypothetical protein